MCLRVTASDPTLSYNAHVLLYIDTQALAWRYQHTVQATLYH